MQAEFKMSKFIFMPLRMGLSEKTAIEHDLE